LGNAEEAATLLLDDGKTTGKETGD